MDLLVQDQGLLLARDPSGGSSGTESCTLLARDHSDRFSTAQGQDS